MTLDLTLSQLVAISTRSSAPPWRFSSLQRIYNVEEISAKSLIEQLDTRQAISFVQVRDLSLVTSAESFADLQELWGSSQPSKQTLMELAQILGSAGASIVYVSRNWQRVGIAGTVGDLAKLKTVSLDDQAS